MAQDYTSMKPIRAYIQHVLPLVYDDSLSYYELLSKVLNAVNELIDNQNAIPDYVKELVEEYIQSGEIGEVMRDVLSNYMLNVQNPPNGIEGATPDGSTDCTAAFQACIDYASERGGGAVYVPSGRYLTQPLEMKSNVCLFGFDRYSTVIVARGGATKPIIHGNVENVSIQNIGIDGNMDIQVDNINAVELTVENALFNNLCITDGYELLNLICNGGNVQVSNVDFGYAVVSAMNFRKSNKPVTLIVNDIIVNEISVLKGEYAVKSEIDNAVFDNVVINAAVPVGVIVEANNVVFNGRVVNAVEDFINRGNYNLLVNYGVNRHESFSGQIRSDAGSVSENIKYLKSTTANALAETVHGMKTIAADSIRETVAGYKETSADSARETIADEKVIAAGSMTETVAGAKTMSAENVTETVTGAKTVNAEDFILNSRNPMTYKTPVDLGENKKGVPFKDESGNLYNVLVHNVDALEDKTKRNVIEFGAKGDGITDNTTAFQTAIDWLSDNGGGILFVPSGNYRVNNTLYLKPFVSVIGEQERKTTITYYGTTALFNSANANMNGVVFGNLTLSKNGSREGTAFLGGSTLANYNSALITFFNLCVIGFNDGIKGNAEPDGVGIFDSTFINVWVSDCNNGFHCFGSQNTFVNPRVTNCMQGFNFDYLNTESYDGASITGGVFVNNDYDIFVPKVNGVRPISFDGTWFENSKYGLINVPNAGTKHMGFAFKNCLINSRCEASQLLINANNFSNEIVLDGCVLHKTIESANTSFNNCAIRNCYEKNMGEDATPIAFVVDECTPQMFGAKADGVTDDTNAIKRAIEAANTVYFPDGTYLITECINVPYGKNIVGSSANSCAVVNNATSECFSLASNNTIKDISLRGKETDAANGFALAIAGSYSTLHNIIIWHGYNHIVFHGSGHAVSNVFCLAAKNDAFTFDNVNDVYMVNAYAVQCGGHGIIAETFCEALNIVNSTSLMCGKGFKFSGLTRFCKFTNVYVDSSATDCLLLGCTDIIFTNCWFSNRVESADANRSVFVHNCANITFNACDFCNNAFVALYLHTGNKNINITNCQFDSTNGRDILIESDAKGIIITGNTFSNFYMDTNVSDGIFYAGSEPFPAIITHNVFRDSVKILLAPQPNDIMIIEKNIFY